MTAPLLVCDFDGTLAQRDLGDAICERFAAPTWVQSRQAWREGRLTLAQAQVEMWSTVRASQSELLDYVDEVGALRDGAETLLRVAEEGRIELIVASGGFDLYIEHILGDRRAHLSALYCNELYPSVDGARLRFPHTELASGPYAVDKARVIARHVSERGRVAFAGDGNSDRSVAGLPDVELFVVQGSLLERFCNVQGCPHVSFRDFREIVTTLLG